MKNPRELSFFWEQEILSSELSPKLIKGRLYMISLGVKKLASNLIIISSVMLFLAVIRLPYGYYQFLRLIITISAGLGLYVIHIQSKYQFTEVLFLIVFLLFNPIFPIHLSRSIWGPIDISVGLFFLWSGYKLRNIDGQN